MKKSITMSIVILVITTLLFGCAPGEAITIVDGTYRAEFSDFDSHGYKEYVEITFMNGEVTAIIADAISKADGTLKSKSDTYKSDMQVQVGTYPEKYYKDLINQYLDGTTSGKVDIVAGATWTSNDFIMLVKALEDAVLKGNTETVLVTRK